jgi:hypothetical protein
MSLRWRHLLGSLAKRELWPKPRWMSQTAGAARGRLQIGVIHRRRKRREASRVSFLMCPSEEEPVAMVSSYLRSARNVKPEDAEALEDIFRAAYNRLVRES